MIADVTADLIADVIPDVIARVIPAAEHGGRPGADISNRTAVGSPVAGH
ncbi:hypothetical protein P3L51_08610 [Streptomyces sp. PSRA5]